MSDQTETDETLAQVAAVLGGHRLHASLNVCTGCDWRATPGAGPLTDQHRAHLAAALLPLIREREAAAWDLGYYRGVRDGTEDTDAAANPYTGSEGGE